MPRTRDEVWNHFEVLEQHPGGGTRKVQCNFCQKVFSAHAGRARNHLAGIACDGVSPCAAVSSGVKAYFTGRARGEPAVQVALSRLKQTILPERYEMSARDAADRAIAKCFVTGGLAFNLVENEDFTEMVACIAAAGPSYRHPKRTKLSTTLIDTLHSDVTHQLEGVKQLWSSSGVTIVSDGWKDVASRPLLNFMVVSPTGSVFWKSINTTGHVKTGPYLAQCLSDVVKEVGPELVVQVVTDSANNCVNACDILQQEFPAIPRTPCATHSMNLLMKSIGSLPWWTPMLEDTKLIVNFFKNRDAPLAMLRQESPDCMLVGYSITRFASQFLMVRRLLRLQHVLGRVVASEQFVEYEERERAQGLDRGIAVSSMRVLIQNRTFWGTVQLFVDHLRAVYIVLRIFDGNREVLGELWPRMTTIIADQHLALHATSCPTAIKELQGSLDLMKARFKWMRRPIHAAAFLLHPKYAVQSVRQHEDPEVMEGWRSYLKMLHGETEAGLAKTRALNHDLEKYEQGLGSFGTAQAKSDRLAVKGSRWWHDHGGDTPRLQKLAIRLIGQCTSNSAAERNWAFHDWMETEKRNRLSSATADKLAFIATNLQVMRAMPAYSSATDSRSNPQNDDVDENLEDEGDTNFAALPQEYEDLDQDELYMYM